MSSDTVVRARIDSDTKARATEALQAMGLSVSDAIRLLLLRVADEKRLPFAVQVPSTDTLQGHEGTGRRQGPALWQCRGTVPGPRHLTCCFLFVLRSSNAMCEEPGREART